MKQIFSIFSIIALVLCMVFITQQGPLDIVASTPDTEMQAANYSVETVKQNCSIAADCSENHSILNQALSNISSDILDNRPRQMVQLEQGSRGATIINYQANAFHKTLHNQHKRPFTEYVSCYGLWNTCV